MDAVVLAVAMTIAIVRVGTVPVLPPSQMVLVYFIVSRSSLFSYSRIFTLFLPGAGTDGGAVGKNHNNFVKNAIFLANTTDSTVVPGAPPPEGGGGLPRPEGGGVLVLGPGLSNDGCDDQHCVCVCGASSISNGISLLYPIKILAF